MALAKPDECCFLKITFPVDNIFFNHTSASFLGNTKAFVAIKQVLS